MSKVVYIGNIVEKISSGNYKVEPSAYNASLEILDGENYKYFENGEFSIMIGDSLLLDMPELENKGENIDILFNNMSDYLISTQDSNFSSLEMDSGIYDGSVGDFVKILDNREQPPEPSGNGLATAIIRFDGNMTVLVKYNEDTKELSYEVIGG